MLGPSVHGCFSQPEARTFFVGRKCSTCGGCVMCRLVLPLRGYRSHRCESTHRFRNSREVSQFRHCRSAQNNSSYAHRANSGRPRFPDLCDRKSQGERLSSPTRWGISGRREIVQNSHRLTCGQFYTRDSRSCERLEFLSRISLIGTNLPHRDFLWCNDYRLHWYIHKKLWLKISLSTQINEWSIPKSFFQ